MRVGGGWKWAVRSFGQGKNGKECRPESGKDGVLVGVAQTRLKLVSTRHVCAAENLMVLG